MNIIKRGAVVLALTGVAAFAGAGMASAAECGTPAKDAVYQTVVSPAVPATYAPDVKVIDVPGTPAVEEVSHIEHRLVTPGADAYDEVVTPSQWWNWSPNDTKGPQDYEPAFPVDERGTWQGPHTEGGPDGEGTFNVSHGSSGNSSWFHREPAVVVHHDAVPPVYEDVKVIDVVGKPAVDEVSHTEKGALLTPGTPESSTQVLVSKAVDAGKPCVVTTVARTTPTPPEDAQLLAFTGPSNDSGKLAGIAVALLLIGAATSAAARKVRSQV